MIQEPCPRQQSPGSGLARARRPLPRQRADRCQHHDQAAQDSGPRTTLWRRAARLMTKRRHHRRPAGTFGRAAGDGVAARRLSPATRTLPSPTWRTELRAVAAGGAGFAAAARVAEGEDEADPRLRRGQQRQQQTARRPRQRQDTQSPRISMRVSCPAQNLRTRRPPPGQCQRSSFGGGGRSGQRWARYSRTIAMSAQPVGVATPTLCAQHHSSRGAAKAMIFHLGLPGGRISPSHVQHETVQP